MPKIKVKKGFFRPVHLQAILFLIVYSIFSKTILIGSASSSNLIISFLYPYIFGVVAGIVFLYLFNHEDFFHFIKEVKRRENRKEREYLHKYKHFGNIVAALIIAAVGGPIFAALTIRFLLNRFRYRYLLIAIGNIPATLLIVAVAKGLIKFVF